MKVPPQKSVFTWVIALGVLTLFIAGSSSGSMGSPDKNRDGCKINHRVMANSMNAVDTLPIITRQQLSGTWHYRSIDTFHRGLGNRPGGIYTAAKRINGQEVPLTLTAVDTMRIAENGPFTYTIGAINKKSLGTCPSGSLRPALLQNRVSIGVILRTRIHNPRAHSQI